MTEVEWLSCADPTPMLDFLRGKVSDRKLRLLCCGYSRGQWHLLDDERSKQAVDLAELVADGVAPIQQLHAIYAAASKVSYRFRRIDKVNAAHIAAIASWHYSDPATYALKEAHHFRLQLSPVVSVIS